MIKFYLRRIFDVTGTSGTGIIAEGVIFTDGTVAMRWKTETASTCIYNSINDVVKIHGHNGASIVETEEGVTLGAIPFVARPRPPLRKTS
jgi:hypothetical protein